MSRTRRNYQTWIDWIGNFHEKLERGHVSMPKREVLKGASRNHGCDEVWGKQGKRDRKRLLTRKRRRSEKSELRETDEQWIRSSLPNTWQS